MADERHGLRPCERGPLRVCVERGLTPGRKAIESLLGLAARAGVFRMHVDAIGAAVELGGTSLDQIQEARLQSGAPHGGLGPAPPPDPLRCDPSHVDALLYCSSR